MILWVLGLQRLSLIKQRVPSLCSPKLAPALLLHICLTVQGKGLANPPVGVQSHAFGCTVLLLSLLWHIRRLFFKRCKLISYSHAKAQRSPSEGHGLRLMLSFMSRWSSGGQRSSKHQAHPRRRRWDSVRFSFTAQGILLFHLWLLRWVRRANLMLAFGFKKKKSKHLGKKILGLFSSVSQGLKEGREGYAVRNSFSWSIQSFPRPQFVSLSRQQQMETES